MSPRETSRVVTAGDIKGRRRSGSIEAEKQNRRRRRYCCEKYCRSQRGYNIANTVGNVVSAAQILSRITAVRVWAYSQTYGVDAEWRKLTKQEWQINREVSDTEDE